MDSIQKLTDLFARFPGIGPRQARRFVYYLLRQNPAYIRELTSAIREVKKNVRVCKESYAFFYADKDETLHPIARDPRRDNTQLLVVEKDSDLESIEKSGVYTGKYFVLGGTVPILAENPEKKIRAFELEKIISKKIDEGLAEVILALSATPEGENTAEYIAGLLKHFVSAKQIRISVLGRGLSTGSELEYSDKETIRNAFEGRK